MVGFDAAQLGVAHVGEVAEQNQPAAEQVQVGSQPRLHSVRHFSSNPLWPNDTVHLRGGW
jgi:hypothetical protein